MTESTPSAQEARVEVEVRYAETDQMGVVHHAVYPIWFELARTRLCEATGYHYSEIEKLGYRLMVTGIDIAYRRPARYGDTVEIRCRIARLGSRGLRFDYDILRGRDRLARGSTEHVWLEVDNNKVCRLPRPLAEPFRRVAGQDGTVSGVDP